MDELLAQAMNRRRLLKMAAGGAAAAGLAPLLGAAPASARSSAGNIKMWWWGQQEAVGIQTWMDDTIKKFKAQTGSSVSPTLMDTAQVIPQFTKAAAAGNVPDVQFLFNGIYHMENVWLGYLKPLNGLVSAATIKQRRRHEALATTRARRTARASTRSPSASQYNKDHFDKAGLNADSPPTTWDAFMDALRQAQVEGLHPARRRRQGRLPRRVVARQLADAEPQQRGRCAQPLHRQARLARAEVPRALGQAPGALRRQVLERRRHVARPLPGHPALQHRQGVDGAQQHAGAARLAEEARQGQRRLHEAADVRHRQDGAVPDRRHAGLRHPDQGQGSRRRPRSSSTSCTPRSASRPTGRSSQQIPADSRFDPSVINNPLIKATYNKFIKAKHNVYIADLMPALFWTDAMFVISQKILGGSMKGAESGELRRQDHAEVEEAEPGRGQALHDLGQGPEDRVSARRSSRGRGGADGEGAAVGAVPLLRAAGGAAGVHLRLPDGQGRRLLDAPRPRLERALHRARQLPQRARRPDLPQRRAPQRDAAAGRAGAARRSRSSCRCCCTSRCAAGASTAACCSCRTSSPCRSSASSRATCSRSTASSTTCSRRSG